MTQLYGVETCQLGDESRVDVLRQISCDERAHRKRSIRRAASARS
ncbi:MAG: hypothetical protein QOJ67_506 [Acidimicrobiaceae bacterium]